MTYLSEAERRFVHEQTVCVLEEVGVGYNSPAAIDLLEEAGAEVDRTRLRARLPWGLVERCLKTCPRRVRLVGRVPGADVVLGDGSLTFCTDGTGTCMYDEVTGVRSEGTAHALRQMMRLFDALPEVDYAWPSISLNCFSKHLQDEVREVAHVRPLLEIFEAVAGGSLWDRPIFSTINCTIAPLQHEREMTEANMRTGAYLCGAPEVGLINVICIEMSRFYGLPVTGSAVTSDAKASNLQAGSEGMLTGLACVLAGADSMLAFGLMDGAETASLAKVIMDCDVVGMIERFVRQDPIDATTALFGDIAKVGVGGHYLGAKSTRHFRRAGGLWQPRVFQREPCESYVGRSLINDAAEQARDLLAAHEVPPLADDVVAEIDRVVEGFALDVGAPESRVHWRERV
ncbi:MAG: trimethylamine methyltransferase family protein [Actinobacteria bacterium]|nr:trimethylamine methyltransferase family protein [Actinomycetota bacterium]